MTGELSFFVVGIFVGAVLVFWLPARWLNKARAYLAEQHGDEQRQKGAKP